MSDILNIPKKCVFVLGMHRSGTSVMAGVLKCLGYNLGKHLLPPLESNPKGYFENEKIFVLNEKILLKLDRAWDSPALLHNFELTKYELQNIKDSVKQILIEEFSDKDQQDKPIAIKDPRLSILLPIWKTVFDELKIDYSFIIMLRHPDEVCKSLAKRDGFQAERSLTLWMNYMSRAEFFTRGEQRVIVHYDDLLKDPFKRLNVISSTFGLKLEIGKAEKELINEFVDTGLNHYSDTDKSVKHFPVEVKENYLLLEKASAKGKLTKLVVDQLDIFYAKFYKYQNFFYDDEVIKKLSPTRDAKKIYAQLFVDVGNSFNEKDTIVLPITKETDTINFDLRSFSEIEHLRFDPCNCRALVRLDKIQVILENGEIKPLETTSNAISNDENKFLFSTIDPIFQIKHDFAKNNQPVKFQALLKFEAFDEETVPFIIEHMESAEKLNQGKISEKEKQVQQLYNQIESLKLELENSAYDASQRTKDEHKHDPSIDENITFLTNKIKSLEGELQLRENMLTEQKTSDSVAVTEVLQQVDKLTLEMEALNRLRSEERAAFERTQSALESKLSKIVNRLAERDSALKTTRKQNTKLLRRLDAKDGKLELKEHEVEASEKLVDELKRIIREKDTVIEQVQHSVKDRDITIESLREKVDANAQKSELLEGLIAEHKKISDQKDAMFNRSEKELQELSGEYNVLRRELKEKDGELGQKVIKVRELEADALRTAGSITEKEMRIKSLEAEVLKVTESKEQQGIRIRELETDLASATDSLNQKESGLKALEAEALHTKESVNQKESRIKELEADLASATDSLNQKESRIKALEAEALQNTENVNEKETRIKELEEAFVLVSENLKLKDEAFEALLASKEKLSGLLSSKENSLKTTMQSINGIKENIAGIQGALEAKVGAYDDLKSLNAEFSREVKQKEVKIEELSKQVEHSAKTLQDIQEQNRTEVLNLEHMVEEKGEAIVAVQQELQASLEEKEQKQAKIEELEDLTKQKDYKLSELAENIAQSESENERNQERLVLTEETINSYEKMVTDQTDQLRSQEDILKKQEAELSLLQDNLYDEQESHARLEQEYADFKVKLQEYENTFGYKIANLISGPFPKGAENNNGTYQPEKDKSKFWFWRRFLMESVSHPGKFIKGINRKNLVTLRTALKNEPPTLILTNLRKYLGQRTIDTEHVEISGDGGRGVSENNMLAEGAPLAISANENAASNGKAKSKDKGKSKKGGFIAKIKADEKYRALAFNPDFYINFYKDVKKYTKGDKAKSLDHWLKHGIKEGRVASPAFDPKYYLEKNKDVVNYSKGDYVKVVKHWLEYGFKEGRWSSPAYKAKFYLQHNKDVEKYTKGDWEKTLRHWLNYGIKEGRKASPMFDPQYYVERNKDVKAFTKGNQSEILNHWLKFGIAENRPAIKVDEFKSLSDDVNKKFFLEIDGNIPTDTSKKTILLVAHAVGKYIYGGERSYLDISSLIDKEQYNVVAVIPNMNDAFVDLLKPNTSKILGFKYGWWTYNKRYNNNTILKFKKIIELFNVNLIHANTIMLLDVCEAASQFGVRTIIHARELISRDKPLQRKIETNAENIIEVVKDSTDYIIANSSITLGEFNKENATFVVPNLVTDAYLDVENSINPNEIKIGLISSNIAKKGVEDFVMLANDVSKHTDKVKFLLIGQETDLTRRLKKEQEAGRITENVIFYGYVKNAIDAHKAVDIVINFSHFAESFGRTIAEAMLAARPTIVYRYGALPELVVQEETGYLINYKAWQEATPIILDLIKHPEKIKRLGEQGRARALHTVTSKVISERLNGIYKAIFDEDREAVQRLSVPILSLDSGGYHVDGIRVEQNNSNGVVAVAPQPVKVKPAPKELKIAYFVWHFPVPSETFVLNELKHLVNSGHDVRVYCKQSPHKDFKPDFDITWERVVSVEDLADKLVQSGRTVAHSIFVYPTVTEFLYPACVKANIPFTFAAHAAGIFKYANIEKNRIAEVVSSSHCLGVMVPGKFHLDYLMEQGVPRPKIIINPQVFDNKAYEQYDKADHVKLRTKKVCAIGRFVEKKGYAYLIQAAKYLPDISFNIYGYGDLEPEYEKLIQEYKLNNVFLKGKLAGKDAIIEVFNTHDLFIQPSVRASNGDMDGIPTILMEAMASEIPVITTPVSSIGSLVLDGINGFYCKIKDPKSIVEAIRSYYNASPAKIATMLDNAKTKLNSYFSIDKSMDVLKWTWAQKTIDIIIVSYNNLPELKEVVRRVFKYTSTPFHLVIVDNASEKDVVEYLDKLDRSSDRVTVKFLAKNVFVGPGSNIAIESSNSDYIVYLCGKEGFVLHQSWEMPVLHYMNENPKIGVAGTLCYSPTYLTGKDYPKGVPLFDKFRNKDFALNNPDRIFKHVQGGLFVMRRKMIDEIGGFSDDVYHNYTDVEFSYYVESMGWELGTLPDFLALFNKTRPGLESRLDENIVAIHPGDLEMKPLLNQIERESVNLCNVCNWYGKSFIVKNDDHICPECSSDSKTRSLYRYFSESPFSFRRLTSMHVNLNDSIKAFWTKSFQGKVFTSKELEKIIKKKGALENRSGGLYIIALNDALRAGDDYNDKLLQEVYRLLDPKGYLVVYNNYDGADHLSGYKGRTKSMTYETLRQTLEKNKFSIVEVKSYQSKIVRFDYRKLLICQK